MTEQPQEQVQIVMDPVLGLYLDGEINPEKLIGKLAWVSARISIALTELKQARQQELDAKHEWQNAYKEAYEEAERMGATSKADAERTATRTSMRKKQAFEQATLKCAELDKELESYYRGQVPVLQSLNRTFTTQYETEARLAGYGA